MSNNTNLAKPFRLITVFLLCLAITDRSAAQVQDKPLHATSLTITKDLTYATVGDRKLQLDLHVPKSTTPPQLIVWIHGGGWRQGSRNKPRIQFVTDHGFALASISYRFTPDFTFPDQIHDCKAAIRWLRANAQNYGYDASKIGVAGSSAGGHLALLLGTSGDVAELEGDLGKHIDQSSKVQAVVDYFGPSDFPLRETTNPERALTTKSGSFALLDGVRTGMVNQTKAKAASPVTWVSNDDPPLLIIHGKQDDVVLPVQATRMNAVYKKANRDVTLMLHPKAKHGSKSLFADEFKSAVIDFFSRNLKR
ncbi:MAG: alpha/beta hydrolase [Fuerstiella sp.]